jgi:hypothetical protein
MIMFRKVMAQEAGAIKRAIRRRYYILMKPRYVAAQLKKRRGSCGKHGCCNLSLTSRILNTRLRKCLLAKEPAVCRHWAALPLECRIYPMDEKDKIPETKRYCNFYWQD